MLNRKLLIKVYVFYMVLLSWVILFKMNIPKYCINDHGINLIPFADRDFYGSAFARYACEIGNVITFVPAGLYLPLFFKEDKMMNRILKVIGFILLLSLFFEVTQYVFKIGISSTTDLIHNLLGGLVGLVLYETLKRFVQNKTIDKINKYTLYILIPVCVFAFVNTLIHINLYL